MTTEIFRTGNLNKKNSNLLEKIKTILNEYSEQGIKVTLRQLYYQLVSRDIIPNKSNEYNKLSGLLTNARYYGMIDWDAIEDRIRIPKIPNVFPDIDNLIYSACQSYQLDRWEGQENYVEIWSEKDALSSVIYPLISKYQITFVVNRGYASATSMYEASQRFIKQEDKKNIILYLGDHDPSGLDMIRDIKERLTEFGIEVLVIPIALSQEQIEAYKLPPNPAKITDPRAKWYIETYGNKSWEVDALRPDVLQELIEENILNFLNLEKYEKVKKQELRDIKKLKKRTKEDKKK